MPSSPPRRRWWRPIAHRLFRRPSEILIVSTNGRPAWIAADLSPGRARRGRPGDFVTPSARLARAVADENTRQMPLDGPAPPRSPGTCAVVVTRSLDEAVARSQRMAPEHVVCDARPSPRG